MNNSTDMAIIGPIIKEQQKIINDTVDKKLALSKLQSTIWEKASQRNDNENFNITDIDDSLIQDLLKQDISNSKDTDTYSMNK
jgi:hypothetical protein